MRFDSILNGNIVGVEYDFDDIGNFKDFYVLISTKEGPVNIAKYLYPSQIDSLQYEAQMHYLEITVNSNE